MKVTIAMTPGTKGRSWRRKIAAGRGRAREIVGSLLATAADPGLNGTMRPSLLLFASFLAAAPGLAQVDAPLIGDRPLQTVSAVTVPVGTVQNELGYTHADADGRTVQTLGEWLFRWGVVRDAEVRLVIGSLAWAEDAGGDRHQGWTDGGVALKWTSQHGRGPMPTAALVLGTSLPTGDHPFQEDTLQPAAVIAMDWALGRRVGVGVNVGYAWASRDLARYDEWSGSLALTAELGAGFGLLLEGYGFLKEQPGGDATGYWNGGLTYRLTSRLLLDARVGGGSGDVQRMGVGIVWRGLV
jgi:hypothetical protein